jgi:hypothetical protein
MVSGALGGAATMKVGLSAAATYADWLAAKGFGGALSSELEDVIKSTPSALSGGIMGTFLSDKYNTPETNQNCPK